MFDLLGEHRGLIAAGRLDRDTSGLLVLTDDTDFADSITSPESHVPKTYIVKARSFLKDEQLEQLRRGVTLSDGLMRPAEIRRLRNPGGKTVLEIVITEGRNRQVRRMIEAIGSKVVSLVRVAIGPVQLGGLPAGQWRALTAEEVAALRRAERRDLK